MLPLLRQLQCSGYVCVLWVCRGAAPAHLRVLHLRAQWQTGWVSPAGWSPSGSGWVGSAATACHARVEVTLPQFAAFWNSGMDTAAGKQCRLDVWPGSQENRGLQAQLCSFGAVPRLLGRNQEPTWGAAQPSPRMWLQPQPWPSSGQRGWALSQGKCCESAQSSSDRAGTSTGRRRCPERLGSLVPSWAWRHGQLVPQIPALLFPNVGNNQSSTQMHPLTVPEGHRSTGDSHKTCWPSPSAGPECAAHLFCNK